MHIQKFKSNKRKVVRPFAAALLASTMLAIPLSALPVLTDAMAAPATAEQQQKEFAEIIAKVRPTVVSIMVVKTSKAKLGDTFKKGPKMPDMERFKEFFKRFDIPEDFKQSFKIPGAQGSGFFVSEDGHIVTSHHIVEGAEKITVRTHDGKDYKAELIGSDQKTDLAVLKVKGDNFKYVSFGDSDSMRVGDWVVAVGNPFGLDGTTTAGIVSARGRDIGSGPHDYLQIDAPINRGNSGGPTFNSKGKVIGINTAIFSPSGGNVGVGFALPSNDVKKVVAELIKDGAVKRGWLGVTIQTMTKDIASSLGLEKDAGAIVASVTEDSPASKAGLTPGDVVQSVDGNTVKNARDLSRIIAEMDPEADIKLKIWRDGKSITKRAKLGNHSSQKVASAKDNKKSRVKLGLMLQNSKQGVVVAEVEPGSPADEKGFETGDIIRKVDGRQVKTAKDVRQAVVEATKEGKDRILMLVEGENGSHFVAVKVKRG